LRVYNNNGTYELENNGTTAGGGGCGANGEGPGTGEFYCGDFYDNPAIHEETTLGGLAIKRGTGEVLVTVMDPFATWSGGVSAFNNSSGVTNRRFQLYASNGGGTGTFGKAAGLGDMELSCEALPISIGDLVWLDADGDGIQDPGESGLGNVMVTLTDDSDVVVTTTTTDANGFYSFNDGNVSGGLEYNTDYKIKISLAVVQPIDPTVGTTSPVNTGNGTNDNDANMVGSDAVVEFSTGG